ncbi:hypothetical protein RRG08_062373 [Elysia crispata]|uniref:Uncharacterized protein n=1 Tax=Elysia crispata TaxID=231223 RepID=A0AAE1CYD2_9GAST|nr:hypothetical protein RRG08_062373 [Elysia crispata]
MLALLTRLQFLHVKHFFYDIKVNQDRRSEWTRRGQEGWRGEEGASQRQASLNYDCDMTISKGDKHNFPGVLQLPFLAQSRTGQFKYDSFYCQYCLTALLFCEIPPLNLEVVQPKMRMWFPTGPKPPELQFRPSLPELGESLHVTTRDATVADLDDSTHLTK